MSDKVEETSWDLPLAGGGSGRLDRVAGRPTPTMRRSSFRSPHVGYFVAYRHSVGVIALVAASLVVSCKKPRHSDATAEADPAIAKFFERLPYDPALFVAVRPESVKTRQQALRELVRSSGLDAWKDLESAGGLTGLATLLLTEGGIDDLPGWDKTRPIFGALNGADHDEDLSLLFRSLMSDPGHLAPRALHHRILVPATNSETLLSSLRAFFERRGLPPLANRVAGGIAFPLPDSGVLALFAERDGVRLEILTDEYPAERDETRRIERWAAFFSNPPDGGTRIESFRNQRAGGADAVAIYARTRNFYRWNFQAWLGAVAKNDLLVTPTDRYSLLAKGAAAVLGSFPWMSRYAGASGADLVVGLSTSDGISVRIETDKRGAGAPKSDLDLQTQLPLVKKADLYRSAALSLGIDGLPAKELGAVLDECGPVCTGYVLANDPLGGIRSLEQASPSTTVPVHLSTRGRESAGSSSPGTACLVRAAQAMRRIFGALSSTTRKSVDVQDAQAIADLDHSLACASDDPIVAGAAKDIRLTRALFLAERSVLGLHREGAIRLLSVECTRSSEEACVRQRRLAAIPAVHLPELKATCSLPLPMDVGTVETVDSKGASYRAAAEDARPLPVVLEADGRASYASVNAAFARLPEETVYLAFRRADGSTASLPIRRSGPRWVPPPSEVVRLRYGRSRSQAILVSSAGDTVDVKIPKTCTAECPLPSALGDLALRLRATAPVVIVDLPGQVRWQEVISLIAMAECLGEHGSFNPAAANLTFALPALSAGGGRIR